MFARFYWILDASYLFWGLLCSLGRWFPPPRQSRSTAYFASWPPCCSLHHPPDRGQEIPTGLWLKHVETSWVLSSRLGCKANLITATAIPGRWRFHLPPTMVRGDHGIPPPRGVETKHVSFTVMQMAHFFRCVGRGQPRKTWRFWGFPIGRLLQMTIWGLTICQFDMERSTMLWRTVSHLYHGYAIYIYVCKSWANRLQVDTLHIFTWLC